MTTPCFTFSQNSSARRASTAKATTAAIARAVMKKISRSGFSAQKEISNAGRFGSSGAAGSRPWVRAKTKTRIPAVVSKTDCTKKDEVIAG